MINAPGIYDIPAAEYHADPVATPSLSNSIAKILATQTPLHAKMAHPRLNPDFEREHPTKFDLGNAAHEFLLKGLSRIGVVKADDWKTKDARALREQFIAEGKTVLLSREMDAVERMVDAIREAIKEHGDSSDAFVGGTSEQTIVWPEQVGDQRIWCRSMIDWLPPSDPAAREIKVYDLKTTTNASPQEWRRRAFDLNFDMQAAFYSRGLQELLGREVEFRFVVVEVEPPHAVSVVALDQVGLDLGARKVERAMYQWAKCIATGHWPGYAPFTQFISPPPWEIAAVEDREHRRALLREIRQSELPVGFIEHFGV